MLYVTARDNREVWTAHRALTEDRGADGGLLVPFRLSRLSAEYIQSLCTMSTGAILADILNRLFRAGVSASNVAFAVGRRPVRLRQLSHRTVSGELWHNPGDSASWLAQRLSKLLLDGDSRPCSEWMQVAMRIAVLFSLVGQLQAQGQLDENKTVDISCAAGDFSAPMAAWYARAMGLPIGDIICCCNENCAPWELLHQGMLHTDTLAVATQLPQLDIALPPSLERLVHACGGYTEAGCYLQAWRSGEVYKPSAQCLAVMRRGMAARVVSSSRAVDAVRQVFSSSGYLMDGCTALSFTGLQDHRGAAGQSRLTLLLSENSPMLNSTAAAKALGLSDQAFAKLMNQI